MLTTASASLQREFTLCTSLDPALDLPEIPVLAPSEDTEENRAAVEEVRKERERRYRIAIETGRWDVKPGETATLFTFRTIHHTTLTWLRGEIRRQVLSEEEIFEFAFRLALKEIANLPKPIDIKHQALNLTGRKIDLVSERTMEALYDIGREIGEADLGRQIVLELGAIVALRATEGVRPLS